MAWKTRYSVGEVPEDIPRVKAEDLDGALCVGRHDLFDSVEPADHDEAKQYCKKCPVFSACKRRYKEALALTPSMVATGYFGPQGTWAGELIAPRRRVVRVA